MLGFIGTFIAGGIVTALVLRNNPKIAKWFYGAADFVEFKIEKETGKDI